jgi:hypothetical protein
MTWTSSKIGPEDDQTVETCSPCILVCIILYMVCMTDNKLIYVLIETHQDDKCETQTKVFSAFHISQDKVISLHFIIVPITFYYSFITSNNSLKVTEQHFLNC